MHRWWLMRTRKFGCIYLHKFLHSDDDRALHDHPWVNRSILLQGSYIEHTPDGSFLRKQGFCYFRRSTARHRVELLTDEDGKPKSVRALFITGPVVRSWGFWCPKGFVPWREFVDDADNGQVVSVMQRNSSSWTSPI
jgi:hypothetical protein